MNNENKEFFTNDVKTNIIEEEIVLALPTELFDEAKEIAQNTKSDEKFPFTLQYDANQKEFLLSILQTVGAIVENDDEEGHMLTTMMNMTQLAFIKRLDCVERVRTNESMNPFRAEEKAKSLTIKNQQKIDSITDKQSDSIVAMELNSDTSTSTSIQNGVSNDGVSVASVTASARSSCSPCHTNGSMATAREISTESNISGNICCPGAEQWFKFTAPETATYTIYTESFLDTVGALYDCCGNLITSIDDYAPCGKIDFRIIYDLTADNTYYVKVNLYGNDTGSYYLRVTNKVLANSVTINKDTISLVKGVTYELPITPNYTYKGYNGAKRITGLSVSINPSNTNEQKIWWSEEYGDVLECSYDYDNDGDLYIHLTATGIGTAKLYAQDWGGYGKSDVCTINVGYWPEYPKPTINSRESWGAQPVVADRLVARDRKPERIIFHHPKQLFSSTDASKIKKEIKRIQDLHMDDKKCDIAYHFVIDPAGGIWQGAEIDSYKRGHADGYFEDIGVVILGNFSILPLGITLNTLNDNQKNAMKELSKWLCFEYNLKPNTDDEISPITTHRTVCDTICPGESAAPWIENDLKNYINDWYSN